MSDHARIQRTHLDHVAAGALSTVCSEYLQRQNYFLCVMLADNLKIEGNAVVPSAGSALIFWKSNAVVLGMLLLHSIIFTLVAASFRQVTSIYACFPLPVVLPRHSDVPTVQLQTRPLSPSFLAF